MELQPLVRQLGRWFWLIVLCALTAGLIGLTVSRQLPPLYRATATLLISDRFIGGVTPQALATSESVVATYVQLVERRPVLEQVIRELGLSTTPEQLARRVSAEAVPSTQLITIVADGEDPAQAALLAGGLATTLRDLSPQLLGPAWSNMTLSVVEPAAPPSRAVFPRTALNVIIATLVGALVGGGLVALRLLFQRPVEGAASLRHEAGLAVLGVIPAGRGDQGLLTGVPSEGELEAYRQLRARLSSLAPPNQPWAVAVVSPGQGDGKSTIAAFAAIVMARAGRQVILVDANLRRPRLHSLFGLPNESGLSAALRRADVPQSSLLRTAVPNLRLLPAGVVAGDPAELLASRDLAALVQALRAEADLVILDCGPAVEVADGIDAARGCDGVLLVGREGVTRIADLRWAREQLEWAGVDVAGVVIRGDRLPGGLVLSTWGLGQDRAIGKRTGETGPGSVGD